MPDQNADPTSYEDWSQKNREAQIQIATFLRKGPFNVIADTTTAKECWDKLTDRFRGKADKGWLT